MLVEFLRRLAVSPAAAAPGWRWQGRAGAGAGWRPGLGSQGTVRRSGQPSLPTALLAC